MGLHAVQLTPQPMVYVTAVSSMKDIRRTMGTSFQTLGAFLGANGAIPAGPPLAIYHDWTPEQTAIDVGFPVSAADARKATGAVKAGTTPGGSALKAVHHGPYSGFSKTYADIEAEMKDEGVPQGATMWEVYLGEPGVTPDADLVTEIYFPVSAADAAKFPAE